MNTKPRLCIDVFILLHCGNLQNLERRQLEKGQKAAVAVEAKPLLEVEAKKNQRTHGGTAPGVTKNTPIKSDSSVPLKSVQKAVAKQFSVSEGYVYAAHRGLMKPSNL